MSCKQRSAAKKRVHFKCALLCYFRLSAAENMILCKKIQRLTSDRWTERLVVCSIDMKGLTCLWREFLKMNVFNEWRRMSLLHARHKLQVTGNHVNLRPRLKSLKELSKRTAERPFPLIKRGDHLRAQMSSQNTAFYRWDLMWNEFTAVADIAYG